MGWRLKTHEIPRVSDIREHHDDSSAHARARRRRNEGTVEDTEGVDDAMPATAGATTHGTNTQKKSSVAEIPTSYRGGR